MDTIRIKNLRFKTILGVYEFEKTEPRDIVVNITIKADLHKACLSDELDDTIDYHYLSQKIIEDVSGTGMSYELIEKLAGKISDIILTHDARICETTVCVTKPKAFDEADAAEVEITRAAKEKQASVEDIVREIKRYCLERHYTFVTAESCTGGMIGGLVTAEPGISECYPGGIISYANCVKEQFLDVPAEVLNSVGAVSEECARAMADGVRKKFKADFSVAVTGIAGPGGGSADKPVGLVYIATASKNGVCVTKNLFAGDRDTVRKATALNALSRLLSIVCNA